MTETAGIPIGVVIAGANRNDCKLAEATIQSIPIERPAPTPERPQGVCLDKAYDSAEIRTILTDLDFSPHIRSRGEEAKDLRDDPVRRARRWVVERIHSWINRYRGMLIRWSKKTKNHAALLKFSLALITWQQMRVLDG
jgi:hypothetical protein